MMSARTSLAGQRGAGARTIALIGVSNGRLRSDVVRPAVNVYGRTSIGSAGDSPDSHAPRGRVHTTHECGAAGRLDDGTHAFDENGHLVTDLTDVAGRGCQRREIGAVADAHEQQVPVL